MAGLCSNCVPWLTRKRNDVCLCLQHPKQHTLFITVYGCDKTNSDGIQSSLWYSTTSTLRSRVSWEFCMGQRDVLIRFRCGECVCVKGLIWRGAERQGVLQKSGSCLIQEGEQKAGVPPCEQHLPLLISPFPSPPPNTSPPLTSLIYEHFKSSGALNSPYE